MVVLSKRWRAPSGGGRAQAAPTGDPRPSRARDSWTRWSVVFGVQFQAPGVDIIVTVGVGRAGSPQTTLASGSSR